MFSKIFLFFLFSSFLSFSQGTLYSSESIADKLTENADAIVRLSEVDVTIKSVTEMAVKLKRVITVLNEKGDRLVNTHVYYSKILKIKALQILVFDAKGEEIKKVKGKDFKDVSTVRGSTMYSDYRVKYYNYLPVEYPYTIELTYETETSNTAFIPQFIPVLDYSISVEKSSYELHYSTDLTLRVKEKNSDGFSFNKKETEGSVFYEVKSLKAFDSQDYAPSLLEISPSVLFTLNRFGLEGYFAQVNDWKDFGKWMYNDLVKDASDLSDETIKNVKELVKNDTTNIDKARTIYQYVQDKVRYVSVQVGIGGWKPFNASYVDEVGYGDCKALTNYTMSLLNAVGVESNYTVLYAGNSKQDIEYDFPSLQGNHVFLMIPSQKEDIWLECTSQKLPFGFIGDFTDDRDVLVLSREGGVIKHTKKYTPQENKQEIKGDIVLLNDGTINVNAKVISEGIKYGKKYFLDSQSERDLDLHYKKRWNYFNNITLDNFNITNDKNNVKLIEAVRFKAENYVEQLGEHFLLAVNVLNRLPEVPDRYRDRASPLVIDRGFVEIDNVKLRIPFYYKVKSVPESIIIKNKFGSYKSEVVVLNHNTLAYNREFIVNDGEYSKEDYNEFRAFYKDVLNHDNSKVTLVKY